MYQIYSIDTLKAKSLAELKAIAQTIGAVAQDKRSKQSWIEAIQAKQPQPVEQPKTEFDVVGDEVIVDGCAIASIEQNDDLTQPWVVQINGVEIFRADTWAKCFHYVCWHYKNGTLPIPSEPADDYRFHNEQPVNLPRSGKSYFIGNYFLRCVSIGGDYAAVWNVSCDGSVMGEIRMDWRCFWSHTMSLETFATPQEAVVDLYESVQELLEREERGKVIEVIEQHDDEFVVVNRENSNHYVVRPTHPEFKNRCECPDCHYRGAKCKHQIAVESFLKSSLIKQVKQKSCSVCWGSGELGDEDCLECCYYCGGSGISSKVAA